MAHRDREIMPWECRDAENQAEAYFNLPLRASNRALAEENARLKKLLRENCIVWSPVSAAYQKLNRLGPRIRSSICSDTDPYPHLPTEVLLRILKYSLTAKDPIIDPLSKLKPENLTLHEKSRGNQIAIHFLATCKTMHEEGSRILWGQNSFTFTTHEAVRDFAEVDFTYRKNIKHVNFRIIAQFFDDKRRKHNVRRPYHPSIKGDITLRTIPRVNERTYARGGFRCYSWGQVTDFLRALRAPYDPKHEKKLVCPKLLPALESLRIDLVNFLGEFLPMPGSDLHDMASHELGCSLNELQVTGLPIDDAGIKVTSELTGLLRDEGLFLAGHASFVQSNNFLKALPGIWNCFSVVRPWKTSNSRKGHDDSSADESDSESEIGHYHHREPIMPPAPRETGHPSSALNLKDLTIWKRVPTTRDGEERQWTEFCRNTGHLMGEMDELMSDGEEYDICPCCGEPHSSILNLAGPDEVEI